MKELSYNLINSKEELSEFMALLVNQSEFVFDLETNSLETHALDTKIVGIGFCWEEAKAYYIPFNGNIDPKIVLDAIEPVFLDESIGKIGHNIKFDSRVLNRFGIKVNNIKFDTSIASYALVGDRLNHNLDDLSLHYLNHVKIRTKSVIPKKTKTNMNPSMSDATVEVVSVYCMEDVDFCYRLYKLFHSLLLLPENKHCHKLFYGTDMPLASVLLKMECNGVKISEKRIGELRIEVSNRLEELQKEINELSGREVKLTNPNDISSLVYDELELDDKMNIEVELTPSGKMSTSKSTLNKFYGDPIVDRMLEHKMLGKLMNTYITALPDYVSKHTGYIHAFYNQIGTSTARLSNNSPNLQQIPARSEIGKKIREAFVSRYDKGQILSIDYSQAELRILAHMGKEAVFIKAYNNDADVHTSVASEVVYEVPFDQVTKDQRRNCKTVNFGLLYGMRAKKLANELKIPFEEAQLVMEKYMAKMSGLKKFLDDARVFLLENGYTENYFGRRRYIDKIFSDDKFDKWSAEREGANNIIQSTNADMIRLAMVRIQDMLESGNYKTKMIMQVHDELVFDVPEDELDIVTPKIINIMQSIVAFDVTMKAEAKHADNWSEAH